MAENYSPLGYDIQHIKRTTAYTNAVVELMEKATEDITHMKEIGEFDPDKPFKWEDYPMAYKAMEDITLRLATQMVVVIDRGSKDEWLSATKKNDAFIKSIMDTSKLKKSTLKKFQDRNLEALKVFQDRKVYGLDLSQRVWKYVNQYKQNLEDAIDFGLGNGTSADSLSRDVRKFLQDPDRFYRRFRIKVGEDKYGNTIYGRKWKRMIKTPDGNVHWIDEAPESYHPGLGKYRSSYKNAMRLTRSEINMAYRESEWQRWQKLDFVIGYEVHRAEVDVQFKCDICEQLVGRYPKNFKFVGWHPQCKCYITPILMSEKEIEKNNLKELKAAINGTDYKKNESKDAVKKMPLQFTRYIDEMREKIADGKMHITHMPYFIRDNFVGGNIFNGIKPAIESAKPLMTELEAKKIVKDVADKAKKKIDTFDEQLKKLKPEIDRYEKLAKEWGFYITEIEFAIKKKSISMLKSGIKNAEMLYQRNVKNNAEYLKKLKEGYKDVIVLGLKDDMALRIKERILNWDKYTGADNLRDMPTFERYLENVRLKASADASKNDAIIEAKLKQIDDAKTFKEVEKIMNEYTSNFDVSDLNLDNAKALSKVIVKNQIKWGLDKIEIRLSQYDSNSNALMSACGNYIKINKNYFLPDKIKKQYDSMIKNKAKYKEDALRELRLAKEQQEILDKTLNNIKKRLLTETGKDLEFREYQIKEFTKSLNKINKTIDRWQSNIDNDSFRWTTNYRDKGIDEYIMDTIQHEYGHVIHDQLMGGSNVSLQRNRFKDVFGATGREDWLKLYKKNKSKISSWLSEYGATNEKEFMAECMALYMRGETSYMPKPVKAFLDKMLEDAIKAIENL